MPAPMIMPIFIFSFDNNANDKAAGSSQRKKHPERCESHSDCHLNLRASLL
jgi:hypothetical protein